MKVKNNELKLIKQKLLELDKQKKIKFIIFFGSASKGKSTPLSDIDVAVFYDGNSNERFNFRLKACGYLCNKVDVQIFQDLPLVIRKEALNGRILYFKNYQFVFDKAMEIIKEFSTFEKYYNEYFKNLEETAAI